MHSLAEKDGGTRRAACARKKGKSGDQQDQRHTDANARESRIADLGDMPDKYAIDDVVKHINDL